MAGAAQFLELCSNTQLYTRQLRNHFVPRECPVFQESFLDRSATAAKSAEVRFVRRRARQFVRPSWLSMHRVQPKTFGIKFITKKRPPEAIYLRRMDSWTQQRPLRGL